jgi:hypothetical protein
VLKERSGGFWWLPQLIVFSVDRWFHCLQAIWQPLQAVHFDVSIKKDFPSVI